MDTGTARAAWVRTFPILDPVRDIADLPSGEKVDAHIYEQPQETLQQDRSDAQSELESHSSDYPLVIPWYQYQFDPVHYADPTTEESQDHRCDLGEPAYANPTGNATPAPMSIKDQVPFVTTGRPAGAPSALDPYLRWGRATWQQAPTGQISVHRRLGRMGMASRECEAWMGRIRRIRDRATLAAPASTSASGTSMTYMGPEVVRNGLVCSRRVVVEFGVNPGDAEPYGIITSYEVVVRNAP